MINKLNHAVAAVVFILFAFTLHGQTAVNIPDDVLALLTDGSNHWRNITEGEKIIKPDLNQQYYSKEQIKETADNMLLFQKINGGWSKNYDMTAVLTPQQKAIIKKAKSGVNTTIDNGATHSQIEYLAWASYITGDTRYKDACVKGIEYLLTAQYSNGGWPQFFPEKTGYSRFITYNDGAMIGVMNVLLNIIDKRPQYNFIDEKLLLRCRKAWQKGIECILKCQIKEEGQLLAWGQQHDDKDFRPREARAFEPPSISNSESAEIVEHLMKINNPSDEIKRAVTAAVKWFESAKILNISVVKIPANDTVYIYHKTGFDRIIVADSSAKPIWPRFNELKTHRPLFCNRDSKVVYSLAEVDRERRTGYNWYTYEPGRVILKYEDWKKITIPKRIER